MAEVNLLTPAQMQHVLDVTRLLAVTTELDPLLKRIAEAAVSVLGAERASIFLHDPQADELVTTVAMGSQTIRVPANRGIVGAAFASGQVVHVPDAYADERFNRDVDRATGFTTRDVLAAAMADVSGKPLGVLQVVNSPSGVFDESDRLLIQLLADQAGVAIQRYRLQQAAIESLALRHEMELARGVQEAMIPRGRPDVPGLDAAGWTRPASINGGDVFDLWKTPDGRLGVLLADASGHGIAPAMVACQVRTLVRALSEAAGAKADPVRLLSLVNARMHEDLPAGRFVTAFLGFLSPDGTLRWGSAGHGPVLTCDGATRAATALDATMPPLGVTDEMPEDPPPPTQLGAGHSLVVASDGITEAWSPGGEMFGDARLVEMLAPRATDPPDQTIAALRETMAKWQGKEEPQDDQTAVVVVRR